MKTRFRLFLPLLVLLLAVAGLAALAQTTKKSSSKPKPKSAKPKAVAAMPVLPPLPGTGTLSPLKGTDFTFIVAGDNRPQKSGPKQPDVTKGMIADMQQYKPNLFIWTGDVIAGKDPKKPKLIKSEYQAFLALMKTAGAPVFNAPGNHEMNASGNAPCHKMAKLYRQNMVKELYGAFSYGNYAFVALNTDSLKKNANCKPPMLPLSPPSPNAPQGYDNKGLVNQAQINSLDAYLAANAGAQYIFIFMHRPMFPKSGGVGLNEDSTTKLKAVFAKYKNIAYVLAAHEHLYYNALTKDDSPPPCLPRQCDPSKGDCPPYYLVSGGAGAPLHGDTEEEEPEEAGEFDPDAFHNYLVFKVSGGNVTTTLVNCGTDDKQANCKAQPSCPSQ